MKKLLLIGCILSLFVGKTLIAQQTPQLDTSYVGVWVDSTASEQTSNTVLFLLELRKDGSSTLSVISNDTLKMINHGNWSVVDTTLNEISLDWNDPNGHGNLFLNRTDRFLFAKKLRMYYNNYFTMLMTSYHRIVDSASKN